MKKLVKTINCFVLSLMMVLSLSANAFAETSDACREASFPEKDCFIVQESEPEVSAAIAAEASEEVPAEMPEKSAMEAETREEEVSILKEASLSASQVYEDMKTYFRERGCTNTKKDKNGRYTDIGSFWDMLALKALGIPGNTGTDYDNVAYENLNAQVLSKFIIAMVNDGKDPSVYGGKDEGGDVTVNVIDLLKSYYDPETGGYGKPDKNGVKKGAYNHQPFVMYVFGILDEQIGEKAGEFYRSLQNEDGILTTKFNPYDMDTTAWAIIGCHMTGTEYPNEEKALAYMAAHIDEMNANTLSCYLDCLANLEQLTESMIVRMVNDPKIYNAEEKMFLYNKKANVSATQQAAIPLGEFYNGSFYQAYDDAYVAETGLSEKTVYVRIADAKGPLDTADLLKRTKLTVASGASLVLDGVTMASKEVTLLDVFTEAVCAEKLGKDPAAEDLVENRAYINEKLGAADMGFGGLSLTKLYGYDDGSFGYYIDRETSPMSVSDPVPAEDTEVFLFHYDWMSASYAVFDRTEYAGTTRTPAEVTVKKMGYDESWNPVFAGVPAIVSVKDQSSDKTVTFSCKEDGKAVLSGLAAGTYELRAYIDNASAYIVSPYAVLTVSKEGSEGEEKRTPSYTSGAVSAAAAKPANTGSVGAPVTNGTWAQSTDGRWTFRTNAPFRSTWGYIRNIYAPEGKQDAWFFFDADGYMLTGWQRIKDSDGMYRWYYLNPVSDGTLGACFLNTVTPDGYTVNENGAWTVDGKVQEEKAPEMNAAVSSAGTDSEKSAVTGSVTVSLSASVTTTEDKKISFSGSKKFNFPDYEGETAFDLLSEFCEEKGWDLEGDGSYVTAINGLAEFDGGSQSGWMYSVNGKYPNVPAGDYVCEKGDKIIWRYVTSWVDTGM